MAKDIIEKYGQRVGYTKSQIDALHEGGHRIRHVERLAEAAPHYSIEAEIVEAKHCNSGHQIGQKLILDMDGNFITKH
jgi:hypothetical protein